MPDSKRVRLFLTLNKYHVTNIPEAYLLDCELLLVRQFDEDTKWKSEYWLYEQNEATYIVGEVDAPV